MTKSQIDHYHYDCNRLRLKVSARAETTFREFLDDFLKPFRFKIEERQLTIEIQELFDS